MKRTISRRAHGREILEKYPNARLVGLTATPCRADGRGLGNYFDELIIGPQIPELIEQKHLVRTVYYAPTEPNLRASKPAKAITSSISSPTA